MKEVEVKILEIDTEAVVEKLLSLGAEKVFEGDMLATMYDFPDRRFDKEGSFVRLRTKGNTAELVFKKRLLGTVAKSFEETETQVSDLQATRKILEILGLVPLREGRNCHRVSYVIDSTHIEIDTIEGIPTFLEIEVQDESEIAAWVEKLGYAMADAKPWSKREVYAYYGVVLENN